MITFVTYAVVLIISSSIAEPQFRKDYKYVEQQNSFYKVHRQPRSWYDAYKYCNLEGGTLFYPSAAEEVALITAMVMHDFWVGAQDLLGRGAFVDMKGNDISAYEHTVWLPEEPNHATRNEDCVMMNDDGRIYDFGCVELKPFVCKALAQNVTYNSACHTWDEGYFYSEDFQSCYKFHKMPKTWTDAFITCHAEQSYLAIIDDKEEADFITKGVKAISEDVHGDYVKDFIAVGYHDKFEEGDYVTLHGQSLDSVYDEWDKGEPNNMYNIENCGTIKTNGLLNDFNCDVQRILFVCERDVPRMDLGKAY